MAIYMKPNKKLLWQNNDNGATMEVEAAYRIVGSLSVMLILKHEGMFIDKIETFDSNYLLDSLCEQGYIKGHYDFSQTEYESEGIKE